MVLRAAGEAQECLSQQHCAGGTGAGKTTLAQGLADYMCPGSTVVIHEDRYYKDNSHLSFDSRESLNYDHPEAIDLDLLASHVRELISGRIVVQPVYDFATHVRTVETVTIFPAKIIVLEGLFTLFSKLLWDVIDLKIYLDLQDTIRLPRRIERDVKERGRTEESVVRQWNLTVQPMYELFIEPSRTHADLILSGDDPVDCNIARVRKILISKNHL